MAGGPAHARVADVSLATLTRGLGLALCRLSRRLEPGRERDRRDEIAARALLSMIAVKSLRDDDLTAELWRLCDALPIGSRRSEVLLEAATRLERYRALTAEYAPRKDG